MQLQRKVKLYLNIALKKHKNEKHITLLKCRPMLNYSNKKKLNIKIKANKK